MGEEVTNRENSSSPEPEEEKKQINDSWMHQFSSSKGDFQEENIASPAIAESNTSPLAIKWGGAADYVNMEKKNTPTIAPVKIGEIIALVLSVIFCDILIYHGVGFTGYAIILPVLALILFFLSRVTKRGFMVYILMILILLVGLRLFYLGSNYCVFFGIFLLFALAISLRGYSPFIPDAILQSLVIFFRAPLNFEDYSRQLSFRSGKKRFSLKTILAPLGAVILFGFIFIMANPVLKDFFGQWLDRIFQNIRILIPSWGQILFWGFILWCMSGLLYPRIEEIVFKKIETIDPEKFAPSPDHYYPAFRNVLYSLIALFAVYFVFEFYYLWWREIPKGFRYSEYAHQGAAWLTFALALSTLVIGFTFRGGLLRDLRLPMLKKLAWIWSLENFILAVCAFHRTQIYVHYNGLSRMRIVAVFGIAVVVAGFILVVLKVALRKNFLWLVRRHLWALGLTILLYLLIPVDYFVTRYNVNQILSGNPAPAVQIAVHPIGPDGCGFLLGLLDCPDENIREGARALLAKIQIDLEVRDLRAKKKGWSYFQLAEATALQSLRTMSDEWLDYLKDHDKRDGILKKFESYGRRWYD